MTSQLFRFALEILIGLSCSAKQNSQIRLYYLFRIYNAAPTSSRGPDIFTAHVDIQPHLHSEEDDLDERYRSIICQDIEHSCNIVPGLTEKDADRIAGDN